MGSRGWGRGGPRGEERGGLAAWHGVLKSLVRRRGKAAWPVRELAGPLG